MGSDTYTLIKGPGKGLVEYAEKIGEITTTTTHVPSGHVQSDTQSVVGSGFAEMYRDTNLEQVVQVDVQGETTFELSQEAALVFGEAYRLVEGMRPRPMIAARDLDTDAAPITEEVHGPVDEAMADAEPARIRIDHE